MIFRVYRSATTVSIFAFGVATGIASLPVAASGTLELSAGYDYSTGKYGQSVSTEITSIPVSMNYLNGPWRYRLTIPYLSITGNGSVVPGAGGPMAFDNFASGFFGRRGNNAASSTSTVTNTGLGDITASVGYGLFPAGGFYEISAKVKFATADADKGLGSGENDYYLQFDGSVGTGAVTPFFTLGYVVTGDPADFTFNDVPYGSLGLLARNGSSSSLGVVYDYRQATVDGSDDLRQASAFVGWKMSGQWSASVSYSIGFTDSSPDTAVSISLSRRD